MGRRIDVDHLVGALDIARRCGVKRPQLIHDWRRRYRQFPKPIAKFGGALVWDWREVERWARRTGRLDR
jgi:predicted DNA-binding transcriptional regulator AlpA